MHNFPKPICSVFTLLRVTKINYTSKKWRNKLTIWRDNVGEKVGLYSRPAKSEQLQTDIQDNLTEDDIYDTTRSPQTYTAPTFQISAKLNNPRRSYCDLNMCNVGAVRYLGFGRKRIIDYARPPRANRAPADHFSIQSRNDRQSYWWFYKFSHPPGGRISEVCGPKYQIWREHWLDIISCTGFEIRCFLVKTRVQISHVSTPEWIFHVWARTKPLVYIWCGGAAQSGTLKVR